MRHCGVSPEIARVRNRHAHRLRGHAGLGGGRVSHGGRLVWCVCQGVASGRGAPCRPSGSRHTCWCIWGVAPVAVALALLDHDAHRDWLVGGESARRWSTFDRASKWPVVRETGAAEVIHFRRARDFLWITIPLFFISKNFFAQTSKKALGYHLFGVDLTVCYNGIPIQQNTTFCGST